MDRGEKESRLRREQDILSRLENVKRLIEMETTLMTCNGAEQWSGYCLVDRDGKRIGGICDNLMHDVREEIQMQLLSITALCYGDNPDVGEPIPMVEWKHIEGDRHPCDKFHDVWDECLGWNA